MNINFKISTGTISEDDGSIITDDAFSGNDSRPDVNPNHIQGRNNPDHCDLHCIGPLPPGVYVIGGWIDQHPHLGNNVAPLTQISGETYGRGDFFIHGAKASDPPNSSEGCIVVAHDPRLKIRALTEHEPSTVTVMA